MGLSTGMAFDATTVILARQYWRLTEQTESRGVTELQEITRDTFCSLSRAHLMREIKPRCGKRICCDGNYLGIHESPRVDVAQGGDTRLTRKQINFTSHNILRPTIDYEHS